MDILHLNKQWNYNLVHIFMTGKHLNEIDASFFLILKRVNSVKLLFIFENVKMARELSKLKYFHVFSALTFIFTH